MKTDVHFTDTPIYKAVSPLELAAVELAEDAMRSHIEATLQAFAAADWNIQIFAPYPVARYCRDRAKYRRMVARREFVASITKPIRGDISGKRERNPQGIENEIEAAREYASTTFIAYAQKLVAKVGAHESAQIFPKRGVWHESDLVVTLPNGTEETWRTQLVHNVSVLGNPYVQFPTRKVKNGGAK